MENDNSDKKLTIEFAPGCFDNFDGTQEELDEMLADIHKMVEDGSILEKSSSLSLEEFFHEDPEQALQIANQMGLFEGLVDEDGNDVTFEEIKKTMLADRASRLN